MSSRLRSGIIITNILQLHEELVDMITDQLSHPAKDYQVTYKDKRYHFYPAFDKKERLQIKRDIFTLSTNLVRDAFKASVSNNKDVRNMAWNSVIGLLSGENPADHQFVKHDDAEMDEQVNNKVDGSIRAISLNLENYQVKENLGMLDDN